MTSVSSSTMATQQPGSPAARGALELVHVAKQYDARKTLRAVDDFSLSVAPGQFVTLLGPSGCGKTTTLRMIAGFETPTEGDILVDGASIVRLAPDRRPMSMVFQSYALFPHLSVVDNVGFGLTVHHVAKPERAERVEKVMTLMGINQYAERFPHQLSGGQQQRVALARALVMEPSILLFDEPLSNLDAMLRIRMREEIRSIQQRLGITSVFVTHDQSEALTMSDVIVVMSEGRIEQVGAPQEIYHRPASEFVASFVGSANFLDVEVVDVTPDGDAGRATVAFAGTRMQVRCDPARTRPGAMGKLVVRSEDLHVDPAVPAEAAPLDGRVELSLFDGAVIRYAVQTRFGTLHGQSHGFERRLEPGSAVTCHLEPSRLWLVCD
jgi:iron(III) transport system ATP-binding protein